MRYKMPSSCNRLLLVGLIAHLTGLSLQDDIAMTARRLQQLGRDILAWFTPCTTGGIPGCTNAPSRWPNSAQSPSSSAGWISAWSVSAISISSALQACALYLFLVTVADAQGLSYYADPSLCQRLSMTRTELHQARQALITRGLVAYQRPLYQVLALDAAAQRGHPERLARGG